ncbi:hypothetical protein SKAU_G00283020 [Synaphobranchus kaupii]|uniref:Uncharacterized protein n=1 Tax=Synaphobranchus kaupii TaxID=118154 RepID=A0A9Q1INV5_SYNKA|nr:hypothetical protein SKAU_G00283020 [Synaphobranchus kaupii]
MCSGLCWSSTTPSPGSPAALQHRTAAPACRCIWSSSRRCTTPSSTCCRRDGIWPFPLCVRVPYQGAEDLHHRGPHPALHLLTSHTVL